MADDGGQAALMAVYTQYGSPTADAVSVTARTIANLSALTKSLEGEPRESAAHAAAKDEAEAQMRAAPDDVLVQCAGMALLATASSLGHSDRRTIDLAVATLRKYGASSALIAQSACGALFYSLTVELFVHFVSSGAVEAICDVLRAFPEDSGVAISAASVLGPVFLAAESDEPAVVYACAPAQLGVILPALSRHLRVVKGAASSAVSVTICKAIAKLVKTDEARALAVRSGYFSALSVAGRAHPTDVDVQMEIVRSLHVFSTTFSSFDVPAFLGADLVEVITAASHTLSDSPLTVQEDIFFVLAFSLQEVRRRTRLSGSAFFAELIAPGVGAFEAAFAVLRRISTPEPPTPAQFRLAVTALRLIDQVVLYSQEENVPLSSRCRAELILTLHAVDTCFSLLPSSVYPKGDAAMMIYYRVAYLSLLRNQDSSRDLAAETRADTLWAIAAVQSLRKLCASPLLPGDTDLLGAIMQVLVDAFTTTEALVLAVRAGGRAVVSHLDAKLRSGGLLNTREDLPRIMQCLRLQFAVAGGHLGAFPDSELILFPLPPNAKISLPARHCDACGADAADKHVKLCRCAKCLAALYCSSNCQARLPLGAVLPAMC